MRLEVSTSGDMDAAPNCAICNAPAYPECPCESERLQIAVKQAEQRAMEERMAEIRYTPLLEPISTTHTNHPTGTG